MKPSSLTKLSTSDECSRCTARSFRTSITCRTWWVSLMKYSVQSTSQTWKTQES